MSDMLAVNHEALFTMFKGEPGLRKSTQALSYPKPQFWISTDQKMEALLLPIQRWGINPKQIEFEDYSDWDKPKDKLQQFQLNCPFKTIVVDSITSIGDNMTRQVRKNKMSTGGGKNIGGIPVSGLEEFNAESSAFQDMIAMLKDINKFHKVNIILIAHVIGQRKDDSANRSTHHSRVIVTGAERISAKLAAYMTEVYHFNIEQPLVEGGDGKYTIITSHTGNDYARTSLPLPKTIEFNDKELYSGWVKPAIDQLKNTQSIPQTPTTPTNNPFKV